jgi:succinate dehydrogenase / fumarate reductase iron-sulfur subunit
MDILLKVFRFQPEKDSKPHYDTFELEVDPADRILDVLEQVRGYYDGTLAFRRSCAHGVCGSDAMRINGRNALACKVLVRDLGSPKITLEPLIGLKIVKDLIVDMEPFFDAFTAISPYLVQESIPENGKEQLQTPLERERFDDATRCILCAACTTSCPVYWADGSYFGPAVFVNAHRFVFDSRDHGAADRFRVLYGNNGIWRCRTAYNCTEACPRGIQVTQLIAELRRAILSGKID